MRVSKYRAKDKLINNRKRKTSSPKRKIMRQAHNDKECINKAILCLIYVLQYAFNEILNISLYIFFVLSFRTCIFWHVLRIQNCITIKETVCFPWFIDTRQKRWEWELKAKSKKIINFLSHTHTHIASVSFSYIYFNSKKSKMKWCGKCSKTERERRRESKSIFGFAICKSFSNHWKHFQIVENKLFSKETCSIKLCKTCSTKKKESVRSNFTKRVDVFGFVCIFKRIPTI